MLKCRAQNVESRTRENIFAGANGAINDVLARICATVDCEIGLRLASGNFGKVFDFPATFGLVSGIRDRGLIMHDSDSRGKVHFFYQPKVAELDFENEQITTPQRDAKHLKHSLGS